MTAITVTAATYQQRNPRDTPLYQIVEQYFGEFKHVYPERFQEKYGFWQDQFDDTVRAFLECGLYEYGFALVQCDCGYEMAVPFSCKARCFCPSCQQKRATWWAEWLHDEILEHVAHRQYVFTIPKILRGFFRRNRYLLGDLARCAWQAIKDFFQAIDPRATPGAVICIQTAGNLLGWHPHLHTIVTNGYFVDDTFYPLSERVLREGQNTLVQLFRDNVLQMLQDKGVLSQTLAQTILTWRHHSGFSVHTEVFITAGDREGIEKLGRYIMRNPVAQERLSINPDGSILYRSTKVDPNFKGNFRLFKDPLEFLAEVLQHLFPKNFQSIRYYGRYSNASRAKRNRDQETTDEIAIETPEPLNQVPRSVRKAWARLIAKVYHVNPFICPRCGAEMHIKKFILIQDEIQYILNTLGIPFLPRGQPAVNTTNNSDGDYVIVPIEDI